MRNSSSDAVMGGPSSALVLRERYSPSVKDGVVIALVMIIWLYSLMLMYRAWDRILNFSGVQFRANNSSSEKASILWRWLMDRILATSLQREQESQQQPQASMGEKSNLENETNRALEAGSKSGILLSDGSRATLVQLEHGGSIQVLPMVDMQPCPGGDPSGLISVVSETGFARESEATIRLSRPESITSRDRLNSSQGQVDPVAEERIQDPMLTWWGAPKRSPSSSSSSFDDLTHATRAAHQTRDGVDDSNSAFTTVLIEENNDEELRSRPQRSSQGLPRQKTNKDEISLV